MALEPLAVISSVCHPAQKDALALPLHPLQKSLLPDDLLAILHRTLITAVNQVSAPDLNPARLALPALEGSALCFLLHQALSRPTVGEEGCVLHAAYMVQLCPAAAGWHSPQHGSRTWLSRPLCKVFGALGRCIAHNLQLNMRALHVWASHSAHRHANSHLPPTSPSPVGL